VMGDQFCNFEESGSWELPPQSVTVQVHAWVTAEYTLVNPDNEDISTQDITENYDEGLNTAIWLGKLVMEANDDIKVFGEMVLTGPSGYEDDINSYTVEIYKSDNLNNPAVTLNNPEGEVQLFTYNPPDEVTYYGKVVIDAEDDLPAGTYQIEVTISFVPQTQFE